MNGGAPGSSGCGRISPPTPSARDSRIVERSNCVGIEALGADQGHGEDALWCAVHRVRATTGLDVQVATRAGVTDIAVAVAVLVGLARVRDIGTAVAGIADAVTVGIGLTVVRGRRAIVQLVGVVVPVGVLEVVARIAHAVTVHVRLVGVALAGTVIADVPHTVAAVGVPGDLAVEPGCRQHIRQRVAVEIRGVDGTGHRRPRSR